MDYFCCESKRNHGIVSLLKDHLDLVDPVISDGEGEHSESRSSMRPFMLQNEIFWVNNRLLCFLDKPSHWTKRYLERSQSDTSFSPMCTKPHLS